MEIRRFLLPAAVRHDPAVDAWFAEREDALGLLARVWFDVLRGCGEDVTELLHDGQPTACVGDAAFAYVGVARAHVSIGFFAGVALPDPRQMLEGGGKVMRHVKLRPDHLVDAAALHALIRAAYARAEAGR